MGKGKRVRALRAETKEQMKVENAAKAKKQRFQTIAIIAVTVLVLIALVGSVVVQTIHSSRWKSGSIQRNSIVMETENYSVDAAMMSYYFYNTYNNFLNNYSDYIESLGLDTGLPLRQQTSPMGDGSSWFDYILSMTKESVTEYLYLAEKALDKDVKLGDSENAEIQNTLDTFSTAAEENQLDLDTYLSNYFGTGVKEGDVRNCLELAQLAEKYKAMFVDELVYSEKDITAYYEDNLNTYRYVDYHSYAIKAEVADDEEALAAAEAEAKELASVKSAKEFEAWIEAKVRDEAKITDTYTKENLEADVTTQVASSAITKGEYQDTDEMNWLFKDAKKGDIKLFDDDAGTYTVVFCDATPYRNEVLTKNVHYIPLVNDNHGGEKETQKLAEDILANLKKEKFSDEALKEAVSKYSDYEASEETGLFENVSDSYFDVDVNKWFFAKDRKIGDSTIIESEDYYVICHYVSDGDAMWYADCEADLRDKDYNEAVTSWAKDITITEDAEAEENIPDIGD